MKTALVTLLDDKFMIGLEVFMSSFLHHNAWFTHDFIVLDNGLSDKNKKRIKEIYKNTIFRKIDSGNYRGVNFGKTHTRLQSTYYTLEVFNIEGYSKLIFMDMDVLIRGDVSAIFNARGDIAGCKIYRANNDSMTPSINTGVFVFNKKKIPATAYQDMIRLAEIGHSMPDQTVINKYFLGKISFMDKTYNVEKRMLHSKRFQHIVNSATCLHYVGCKPWEPNKPNQLEKGYGSLEKLWLDWFEEHCKKI